MHDFTDKLARLLIGYSAGVRPGEVVSLVGSSLTERLLVALQREVLRAGGHPIVVMKPPEDEVVLYLHGNKDQLSFLDPLEMRRVEVVDAAIYVLTAPERLLPPEIDPARQALHHQARRPLLDQFLRRTAEGKLRWLVTVYPDVIATVEAGTSISFGEWMKVVSTGALLDRPDPARAWRAVSAYQKQLVTRLRTAGELRIMTAGGTDLRLGVAGRTWINGDGHENMPDGEVFTAPIEDSVEGTVCFDWPVSHRGSIVQGVRLVFRAGRVVEASAQQGEQHLLRLLDQDAGAGILGEAALGCNYSLTVPTGHPLLDEKIGGTFHIALGTAPPRTGGVNRSVLHWDLVGDLRQGGRVEADGRPISVNGRFVDPAWPRET